MFPPPSAIARARYNRRMLRIGPLAFDFPVVQAALSGYSDSPMRRIARRLGAPYCLHEVVLDKLVVQPGKLQKQILRLAPDDHPVGGQLMGDEPVQFSLAARAMADAGFDVVDINFGCPVRKVLGRCRGGYLLSTPRTAFEIIRRVRDAVPAVIPVTLKMRRGMDDSLESERNFFRIFDFALESGLAAITVHGRTVQQRYVGPSNWDFLARVKRHAGGHTVLGSGDLFTAGDVLRMLEHTGVDGVTVARGCIGNPWIFSACRALLAGEPAPPPPSVAEQGRVIAEHFELSVDAYGGKVAARIMRKFGIKYSELHPLGTQVRDAFIRVSRAEDWQAVLDAWYDPTRAWPPGVEKTGPGDLIAAGACSVSWCKAPALPEPRLVVQRPPLPPHCLPGARRHPYDPPARKGLPAPAAMSHDRLHILYVSWEYPPEFGGGIGTYVDAITRALAARGHAVTVLTIGGDPYPTRDVHAIDPIPGARADGGFADDAAGVVSVLRLPVLGGIGEGPVGTLRTWQARSDLVADTLQKLVAAGDVHLIEFADYRGEGVTYLATTSPGQRPCCVVRLHTPLSVLFKYNTGHTRHAVLEEYEHQAILAADRVVSPSQALVRELQARLGTLPPVDLSPHPVAAAFVADPGGGAGAPAAAASGEESRDVLYVGRLEERKGVETLAAAAIGFLDACREARVVLIGGDTERSPRERSMREVLLRRVPQRLHERFAIQDKLPRARLMERYRAARFCVFPSHFENFPNTCLEAMALGCCVLAGDNSGMAEMIEPGVSGVCVPSANVDALSRAMIEVYQWPHERRRAMGAAAAARVRSRYGPEVVAQQTEALYSRYLREHRGSIALPTTGAKPRARAARPGASVSPRVAVVVPCFNHGRFLRETLASVQAQTYPHVDCVIVDDGSTDADTRATLDALGREGWTVLHQDNQGLSAARNAGVRATDAPFFVPLDADDRLDPRFIESLLPALRGAARLGYVYSRVAFFGDAAGGWDCPEYDPRRLLVENLSVATALVRRRAFDEAGGYSRDMVHGFEDWDFWIALLSLGYHGRCVPERLFYYRKHAGGSMLSQTQTRRREMVQKMIEHHRAVFASTLAVSLAQKDQMFFTAHMDAWSLRESAAQRGRPEAFAAVDDELHQALLAEAELNYIENSRFWRAWQKLKLNPLYALYARLRYGPAWNTRDERADARQRLAQLKASRAYRTIQALKRTAAYRWYARRKYGADVGQRPA